MAEADAPTTTTTNSSAPKNRSLAALGICLVAATALTAADLASKNWVFHNLSEESDREHPLCVTDEEGRLLAFQRRPTAPVSIIDGFLEFRYAENCGAAFGLLDSQPPEVRKPIFVCAALIATAALLWMFYRNRGGRAFAIAVPLIISGAIGNFYDRVKLGYVVDFVRFHKDGESLYPTFNVADVAISVGVGFLLIDQYQDWKRERAAKKQKPRAAEIKFTRKKKKADEAAPSDEAAEPTPE